MKRLSLIQILEINDIAELILKHISPDLAAINLVSSATHAVVQQEYSRLIEVMMNSVPDKLYTTKTSSRKYSLRYLKRKHIGLRRCRQVYSEADEPIFWVPSTIGTVTEDGIEWEYSKWRELTFTLAEPILVSQIICKFQKHTNECRECRVGRPIVNQVFLRSIQYGYIEFYNDNVWLNDRRCNMRSIAELRRSILVEKRSHAFGMLIGGKVFVSWEDPLEWNELLQYHVDRSFNVPAVATLYILYTAEVRRYCPPLLWEKIWRRRCALPTTFLAIETHFDCCQQ
jgi:hypothetical protein